MNTGETPWLLVHHRMLLPDAGKRTAKRNKAKCDDGSSMLGLDETMLLTVAQDTTASSLNAYGDAQGVSQLRCGGHTWISFTV